MSLCKFSVPSKVGPRQKLVYRSCGYCTVCRKNKQRVWVTRSLLELRSTDHSGGASFVTMTYNDENLPPDGCISKREVQLFLKRLRKKTDRKIRYMFTGEYGKPTNTFRPHYHGIIFGLPYSPKALSLIESAWSKRGQSKGFCKIGDANPKTMRYVTKYLTKRQLMQPAHREIFDKHYMGREPEFLLVSRDPGLGAGMVPRIVQILLRSETERDILLHDWCIRLEGRKYPLGEYLVNKILAGIAAELDDDGFITRVKNQYHSINHMKFMQHIADYGANDPLSLEFDREQEYKELCKIFTDNSRRLTPLYR